MTRLVKDWTEERVDATAVAPHRYTQTLPDNDHEDRKAFFAAVPYKAGDVVYVEHKGQAVPARIIYVFRERNHLGDWREKFRVQLATKKGVWSRSWIYTWPGFIQRGYSLMGFTD